ncbi:MAG: glycosyltransferase [Deltaproteobacteria bacterium]|nr:glycosyltransferase [Deltaproteobacteria bacterium]MBP7285449.1 glycosyltransferase [Nannocystaceae bacterium]
MAASPSWLLVSKPLRAPLRDGTTVLASSLVSALPPGRECAYLGDPGAPLRAGLDRVLPSPPVGYAPGLVDRARLLATLVDPRLRSLHVHLFFSPNPTSQGVLAGLRRGASLRRSGAARRWVQTIPAGDGAERCVGALAVLDAVVVTSEHTRENLLRAGLAPERLHCIRPGVVLPEHLTPVARSQRLLYAGDLDDDVAARAIALAALLQRPELSQWRLTLACRPKGDDDVRARARVRRELADAIADGRVEVLAEVDDMDALLHDTALQLYLADHTRRKVDLPLVLLEGLARGIGLVAVDALPVAEIFEVAARHGCEIGLRVPCEATAAARRIAHALLEPARAAHWGAQARRLAGVAFDRRQMAAAYHELWQELERR